MLLIISNQKDATVDYLVPFLVKSSIPFLRFDTDCCLKKSTLSYEDSTALLEYSGTNYEPGVFDAVWYRRPESLRSPGLAPEEVFTLNEWSEMFENYFALIPSEKWINHPTNNARASHKIHQLEIAKSLGLEVPDTLVTMSEERFKTFYEKHSGKIIVKPMFSGYIDRNGIGNDSLIYTNRVSESYLTRIHEIKACPTLFQEEISKSADVRITILDGTIASVKLLSQNNDGNQGCDIRINNMRGVAYSTIDLPTDVRHGLMALMDYYSLRFAAIDMVIDKNEKWFFLEINPNGQWAWLGRVCTTLALYRYDCYTPEWNGHKNT